MVKANCLNKPGELTVIKFRYEEHTRLQVLEVALRNSIHKEAKNVLGSFWFDNVAYRAVCNLTAAQQRHVKNLSGSISRARTDIRRELNLSRTAPVSEDRIVAKMTFGFWTNLFSAAFDVNRNPQALWPSLLRAVFPNAPRGYRDRATIQRKLLTIKTFRNKTFHHEPIWNVGRPTSVTDSIARLQSTKELILEVIKWVSLDSVELVGKAGYVSAISRICSNEHLDYLKHPGRNKRPVSRVKRELNGILRISKKTTDITLNGPNVGKIINT